MIYFDQKLDVVANLQRKAVRVTFSDTMPDSERITLSMSVSEARALASKLIENAAILDQHQGSEQPPVPIACVHCKATENIQIEPSLTDYPWDGTGVDPNRDLPLCESCRRFYREYWEERWTDYRANLL